MTKSVRPVGAVAKGAAAGIAGTAAMDLVWFARYKKSGGEDGFVDWEFASGLKDWEGAPAPAQVGKRLVEGLFGRELPPEAAAFTNNAVHWTTGVMWGGLFGLATGSLGSPKIRHGLALGPVAWLAGYLVLPLAEVYRPIWDYDAKTLGRDLSAHAVFGLATAAAYRLIARRS